MDSDDLNQNRTDSSGNPISIIESMEGHVLDSRYRLVKLLGSGGAGVVYRATDLSNKRTVAIKLLHEELRTAAHTRSRFIREGKALAKLSHPHIVEILGFGISDDVPYIVMEFLEGQTLEKLLEPVEPLDFDLAIHIARQMLKALSFAHKSKVVHRDLKPENICLLQLESGECHIKLLDFGLAKFLAPDDHTLGHTLTRTGVVMGTPLYMAPEQAVGGKIDVRVDVYAAGAVIFEMLTGRPPFIEDEHHELIRAHLVAETPRLTDYATGKAKDLGLEAFILRAMAKEPPKRFHDAGAMLRALDALPVVSNRNETKWDKALRVIQKGKWVALGVLFLSILLAIGNFIRIGTQKISDQKQETRNRVSPKDPWQAAEVPPALSRIHLKVSKKQIITARDIKEAHEFASDHPSDPRPFLLLAHGFANQHWRRDAINRYLHAYKIDPSSRGDPRMLPDLLDATASHVHGNLACDAIEEIYGNEALAELDRLLNKIDHNSARAARLLALRDKIAQ